MFKRVEKRRRRQEEEEALGLDSDLKEVLGLQETDSEESESSSDEQSEGSGDEEDGSDLELEGADVDEEEDGPEDSEDDEDEGSEDEIEIPLMSVTEAVRDPVYLVSLDPDIKACILCPGKALKNPVMADVHKASKAHNRRFNRFADLVQQAGPDASVADLIKAMNPKPERDAALSKRAEKRKEKLAMVRARRAKRKDKIKKIKEAREKKRKAAGRDASSDNPPDEPPAKKRKVGSKPSAHHSKAKATSSTSDAMDVDTTPKKPKVSKVVSKDESLAASAKQPKKAPQLNVEAALVAKPKRQKRRKGAMKNPALHLPLRAHITAGERIPPTHPAPKWHHPAYPRADRVGMRSSTRSAGDPPIVSGPPRKMHKFRASCIPELTKPLPSTITYPHTSHFTHIMNGSPGDIIVCEASLAGPVTRNNKGIVGLGFNFPVDAVHNSPALESMTGLALAIDSIMEDIARGADAPPTSPPSPPLLGTRRSPQRAAPSPWAEYAPMRTPSPSLRGAAGRMAYLALHLPAPAVPTLPATPHAGAGLTPAVHMPMHVAERTAFAGLGVGLPGFDDESRIVVEPGFTPVMSCTAGSGTHIHPLSAVHICTPSHAGLALGLPGFDGAHLIEVALGDNGMLVLSPVAGAGTNTSLRVLARPGLRRALHRASIDDDNAITPPTSSLEDSPAPMGAYAAPVFHAPPPPAQPRAPLYNRATLGLGFSDEDGEPIQMEGESIIESPPSRRRFPIIEHSPL
ncbi:hypothetical protein EIP86_002220 [Pleurotus ostreatoroseus]|nr:hypothetical protein EIP86_002220 [Pleurotus ostreatoroseus]